MHILLLSPPIHSESPSTNDGTHIQGRSKRLRHNVAPSNSASSGVSIGSIITGLTGSTNTAAAVSGTNAIAGTITGLMNMLTVKEAKKPELNCPADILQGETVSASIPTAMRLHDLPPISNFERNHGMDTVRLSIDSCIGLLKTL